MTDATDPPVATPLSPRLKITFAALAVAALVTIAVILFLVRPVGTELASGSAQTSAPDAGPTTSATPTPTPTAKAPAVDVPDGEAAAPAAPAPPAPAPAAPAPAPAAPPVIPPLKIDSMYAYYPGVCGESGPIVVGWSASGALTGSAELLVKTGGGTPVFNETWAGYEPIDEISLNIDCTRALWYFKLTVSNGTTTKTGLLTFSNGQNVGWSSN